MVAVRKKPRGRKASRAVMVHLRRVSGHPAALYKNLFEGSRFGGCYETSPLLLAVTIVK